MTPIAVLSADTHLAQRAWTKHPGLTGDAYYGLQQLVDYCTAHELVLVLAGDVFDKTRPDPKTIWHMRTQLDRMERNSLAVHYIQGQHELDRERPWINSVSWWPDHQHKQAFTIGDINLYGLDWTPADQVKEEFAAIPTTTDILVAHQVWRDLMGPRIGESECAFADVPVARMILTGDFHRHLQMNAVNKDTATTRILSPGPVCMQSIDENPDKYFFVLCDDMSVQAIKLKTRQCFRVSIATKDDLESFLQVTLPTLLVPQQDVPAEIARNILHVTYDNDIPEVYARIMAAADTDMHVFMSPVKHKQEVVTIQMEKRRALAEGGMEACLELLTDKDTPLYHDVLGLLQSQVPQEQLKTIKATYLQRQELING